MLPYFPVPFSYDGRNSMTDASQMPYLSPEYPVMPAQQFAPAIQCPIIQQMQMNPYTNMTVSPGMTEMNEVLPSETEALRDPPPVLSNNPATASITLFKELTGYPNYGNPSGNADILYTGNRGSWTFDLPAPFIGLGTLRAQIVIRGVLDDHNNVPVSRYSARITVNGATVHNGAVDLVHGSPTGGKFTNWRSLTFNVPNLRRNNRVVITNTSTAGPNDWIGLDWMELRLFMR